MRIVPDQQADVIAAQFCSHVQESFDALRSPNQLTVRHGFLFYVLSVLFSMFFEAFLAFFILSRAFLLTLPKVTVDKRAGWWLGDRKSAAFDAAKQAIRKVWGVEPMLIREGGTIPVTCLLEEVRRFSFFFVMADVQSDVQCASAASAARTKERLCAFGQ